MTSVVPRGLEAYVRILHPFIGPFDGQGRPDLSPRDIAANLDRELHPLAPVDQLIEGLDEAGIEQLDIQLPIPGAIPTTIAQVLADVLGEHTSTPELCYFAIWEGKAGLRPRQGIGAAFQIPGRRMFLYSAPTNAATERFDCESLASAYPPNLWWPADHAWCVATEIDHRCTYVGCDRAAAHELLTHPGLDAFEVQPDDMPWG